MAMLRYQRAMVRANESNNGHDNNRNGFGCAATVEDNMELRLSSFCCLDRLFEKISIINHTALHFFFIVLMNFSLLLFVCAFVFTSPKVASVSTLNKFCRNFSVINGYTCGIVLKPQFTWFTAIRRFVLLAPFALAPALTPNVSIPFFPLHSVDEPFCFLLFQPNEHGYWALFDSANVRCVYVCEWVCWCHRRRARSHLTMDVCTFVFIYENTKMILWSGNNEIGLKSIKGIFNVVVLCV